MDNNNIAAPTLTVEERILQLVSDESEQPRETLNRETVLGDELFDSLGRVELIMALEDEFEISIPEDEADNIHTVGQLIDAIELKLRTLASATQTPDGPDAPPSP